MQAWRAHGFGEPDTLKWERVEDPPLPDDHVRIEVRAAGVNFPDVLLLSGNYQVRPTPPFTPGFEIAGIVVESRTAGVPVGARVAATLQDLGGYATYAIASARETYLLPDAMSFEHAAAITLTYQTGWFGLHRRAQIRAGEWLLVHAGAGGVGSAAIQLGRAAGARIIATAGGAEKVEVCRRLGADVAVDYRTEDFVAVVKEVTGGRGVDVVYDPVGGDVYDRSTRCIAFEGRIVIVGFTSGRFAQARTNHVLVKNYAVLGLNWGSYRTHEPDAVRAAQAEIYGLYATGAVRPMVSAVRPMAEAPLAMAAVAGRETTGKIVLCPHG